MAAVAFLAEDEERIRDLLASVPRRELDRAAWPDPHDALTACTRRDEVLSLVLAGGPADALAGILRRWRAATAREASTAPRWARLALILIVALDAEMAARTDAK